MLALVVSIPHFGLLIIIAVFIGWVNVGTIPTFVDPPTDYQTKIVVSW
jgi:hypothetical protein